MVMNLIMKLGKIVGALLIAAAIIAAATWGISLFFDLGDTFVGNFLGPLGGMQNGQGVAIMDTADSVGNYGEAFGGDVDLGSQGGFND